MKIRGIIFFAAGPCFAALLSACSSDPLDIDVSGTKVSAGYKNLDSLISETDTTNIRTRLLEWSVDIPEVINYELGYCLGVGNVVDPNLVSRLNEFNNNSYIRRVEKQIDAVFPDLPERHAEILEGFRHVKTHLPGSKLPANIVYLNSAHRTSAFSTEKDLAMGLEMYLGPKSDVIRELPSDIYFEWQKEGMNERYFERDAVASWIYTHIAPPKDDANIIEAIIDWGKIIYLTEAAFPEMEKSVIIRYSEEDYQWALENEEPFWKYLVKEGMLFKKDATLQSNFLNDGPFTPGLPEKGPDRLGQFLGWRIVQSYMEQHDVTVQELIQLPFTELLTEYEID